MKKKKFLLTALLGLNFGFFMLTSTSKAATIDITDDMPTSGSVIIKGDKVISASNNTLLHSLTPTKNTLPYLTSLYALNVENGRWVCYSDHHNYINGYKWSHSRFIHYTKNHHASARVGKGQLVTRYAGPGQWADAVAKGYGTAQAWYGTN